MKLLFDAIDVFDAELLLMINGLHNGFLDHAMYAISGKAVWIPLYILLIYGIWKKFGTLHTIRFLVLVALVITLVDQICGCWLRFWVDRMRPSNPMNPISHFLHFVNEYRGGKYGFPSCHAANTMALTVLIGLLFLNRRVWAIMLFWSVTVSCSRLYLGVHYPTDIIAGWIFGGAFAYINYGIWVACSKNHIQRLSHRLRSGILS